VTRCNPRGGAPRRSAIRTRRPLAPDAPTSYAARERLGSAPLWQTLSSPHLSPPRPSGVKILCTTRAAHHTADALRAALAEVGPEETAFYWRAPSGETLLADRLLYAWELAGDDRFAQSQAALNAAREAFTEVAVETAARGLKLFGGLAFAPEVASEWSAFGAGRWLLFGRVRGITEGQAWEQQLELIETAQVEHAHAAEPSVALPAPYADRLAAAAASCRAGELEKLVVANWTDAPVASSVTPATIAAALDDRFAACTTYALLAEGDCFVGATPELLLATDGDSLRTVALAGSAPRGRDEAADALQMAALRRSEKDLREHCIVRDDIFVRLGPLATHITMGVAPAVWALPNIFHLRTPISGLLQPGVTPLSVAAALHPTPAVCGAPRAAAAARLAADEGGARGWYAGAIGWLAGSGDLELVVALRCALLRDNSARLFAGVGVVAASEVAAELAETESKLSAMRGALGLTEAH